MTPRIAAYETLLRCEKEKQYSNIAISNAIKKYEFDKKDRDFFTKLTYGVIEKQLTLDYLVKQYTEKSPNRLDLSVLIILRLSLYQLFFLERIPQSAAVSEGVKLAARFASRAKGYINAILRKACREEPRYPTEDQFPLSYVLSVRYSISEDIVKLLSEQYPDTIEGILKGYSINPTLSLQIHYSGSPVESFIQSHDLPATAVSPLPFAIKLTDPTAISNMPFLNEGKAFVQDVASQITTYVLDPQPDDFIIDVCSCPGGKTFSAANLLASRAKNAPFKGKILSCDLHESKLSLVQNGTKRLGFNFVQTLCHDATQPLDQYFGKADRIICDVPCSGLGVINKKPEIRYKDIKEIHEISKIQYQILETSSKYLKNDGVLLYSTCTLNKDENEKVVEQFLKSHPDFSYQDFEIKGVSFTYRSQNGCLTLFPNELHDGFFMAKLIKK